MRDDCPKYLSAIYGLCRRRSLSIRIGIIAASLAIAVAGTGVPPLEAAAIRDASGRIFTVEKPFTRIISLYGAHTENLFYLGLDAEIIGVSKNEAYPEKASTKPWFSFRDDPEKFLGSRPDLVLVRPMIQRSYPKLIKRLETSGICVVSLQPGTIQEMFDYWVALGQLTGKEEKALAMVHEFQEKLAVFQATAASIPAPKRVYFEAIHSRMKTFTPGSMALAALKAAGGINIAVDAEASRGTNIANYGKERILSHANEIDVYLAQSGIMNPVTVQEIINEPGFSIIKAVQTNHVYLVDEILVSRPGFRLLLGIQQIGDILYPGVFNVMTDKRTNQ